MPTFNADWIASRPMRQHINVFRLREENADGTITDTELGTCAAQAWAKAHERIEALRLGGFVVMNPLDIPGVWFGMQTDITKSFEGVKVMLVSELVSILN